MLELPDLAQFVYAPTPAAGIIPAGADHWLFYVGRDDVHGVLSTLLADVTSSLYLNMYGYDDDALNELVLALVQNPHVLTMITLDKSQAGGKHEAALLAADKAAAASWSSSVTVGESSTRQISHTKGGTIDGRLGFEGSTNWSTGGEGTFVTGHKAAGGPGYKAQNNTLTVFADAASSVARFTAELVAEHTSALASSG